MLPRSSGPGALCPLGLATKYSNTYRHCINQTCTVAWLMKSCFLQPTGIQAIGSLQVKIVFLSLKLIHVCVYLESCGEWFHKQGGGRG